MNVNMNEERENEELSPVYRAVEHEQSFELSTSLSTARRAAINASSFLDQINECPAPQQQQTLQQWQHQQQQQQQQQPQAMYSPISTSPCRSFSGQPKLDSIRRDSEGIFPRLVSVTIKGRNGESNFLIDLEREENLLQALKTEAGLTGAVTRFEWKFNGKPISVPGYKRVNGEVPPDYSLKGLAMFLKSTVEELTVYQPGSTEKSRKRRSCEDAGGLEKAKLSKQMPLGVEDYKRYQRSSQLVLRLKQDRAELAKVLGCANGGNFILNRSVMICPCCSTSLSVTTSGGMFALKQHLVRVHGSDCEGVKLLGNFEKVKNGEGSEELELLDSQAAIAERANKLVKDPRWFNMDILESGDWTKIPKFGINKFFSNAGSQGSNVL